MLRHSVARSWRWGTGGCIVIETRDRVFVYDAGAITGPDITRRVIAPFLWSRGISRIDELFLSHADLDHFNGVPALLQRFAVGRIHTTPTFSDRESPGVQRELDDVRRLGIPISILSAGVRLRSDDVDIEVLHPPRVGPTGKENARSLVLRCHTGPFSILLTGDLEEAGLQQVLSLPPAPVDVLMAPHHGSKTANTPALAAWATPRVAVSCEGRPWRSTKIADPYSNIGALYLPTWPHGAVTIRVEGNELVAETYRTKKRLRLRPG